MGLTNHRDLGGIAAMSGFITRKGRLFRSAAPAPADGPPDSGYALVVDLRCKSEYEAPEHPFARHARVLPVPLLTESEHLWAKENFERIDIPTWYAYVVEERGDRLVRAAAACIATDGPVLVHCAAGKDRTGLLVGLLLRLAGVGAKSVVADYLRSNDHLSEIRRPERGPIPGAARPESINAALAAWDRNGGVAAWFGRHGGSDEAVDSWRSSFLQASR
jgi:protein-tyrosine phosphatase